MRYGISPAEKNELEFAFKCASNNYQGKPLPMLKKHTVEEASELREHRAQQKQMLYGNMRYRQKPTW